MKGSLSNFSEALILDSVFGRSAVYNYPGTLYFALLTAMPDDDDAGGSEVSTSGTGYSRLAVTNSSSNFDATPTSGAGKGIKTNKNALTFATASAAWGTIVGGAIYDASSGGNLLWSWEWAQSRIVAANDTMRVEAEELEFTFNAEDVQNADCVLSFELQCAFLDALFGDPAAPTIPATLYAALMTGIPGYDGGSNVDGDEANYAGAELSATGYARVAIPNTDSYWEDYASNKKTNVSQIVWPVAGAAWSSVIGVAFYDAASSGNLIAKLRTSSTLNWVSGDQPRIAAGALPIYAD